MAKLLVIIVVYILLLLISLYFSYGKNLLTPQTGFLGGFLLQTIYALFWVDEWDLNISDNTFFVLLGGAILFTIVSLTVSSINVQKRNIHVTIKKRRNTGQDYCINERINVNVLNLIVFLVYQLAAIALTINFLRNLLPGNLVAAIWYFRDMSVHTDSKLFFPQWLTYMRLLNSCSAYFWVYLLIHSIVFKYKSHKGLFICSIALSIIGDMLAGARGGTISVIVAGIVYFYFFIEIKNEWKYKIEFNSILRYTILGVIAVLAFPLFGQIIGHLTTLGIFEEVAVYLSAPIKNLDSFIREGHFCQGNSLFNTNTFVYLANFLSGKFGLPSYFHRIYNPMRNVNGHHLGNVSTTYYAFLYDGGYPLMIACLIFMAIAGQFYIKIIKAGTKIKNISISIILYGYLFFTYFFSFFSNKFYETVFTSYFIYTIICWELLKLFMCNVVYRNLKNT